MATDDQGRTVAGDSEDVALAPGDEVTFTAEVVAISGNKARFRVKPTPAAQAAGKNRLELYGDTRFATKKQS